MAEQIGAYYASIGGKDEITPVLRKVQRELELMEEKSARGQKAMQRFLTGGVDVSDARKSFESVRKEINETAAYAHRMRGEMTTMLSKGIDTSAIQRDIAAAEKSLEHYFGLLRKGENSPRSIYNTVFSHIPTEKDATYGIKQIISSFKEENKERIQAASSSETLARSLNKEAAAREKVANAAERTANSTAREKATIVEYSNAIKNLEARLRSLQNGFTSSSMSSRLNAMIKEMEAFRSLASEMIRTPSMLNDKNTKYGMEVMYKDLKSRGAMLRHDAYDDNAKREREYIRQQKEAQKAREQAERDFLSVGLQRNAQRTMTDSERKAFADFYKEQERQAKAALKRQKEEARLDKQYASSMASVNNKLAEYTALRDKLNRQISQFNKLGLNTSSLKAYKAELQSVISAYQQVGGMSKSKVVNGNVVSLLGKETQVSVARVKEGLANARTEARRFGQEMTSALRAASNETNKLSGLWGRFKGELMMFGAGFGLQQLFDSIVKTGGEIEKQHIALRSIIGDLQNADELFGQIKGLALRSPFTFGQLNKDVKQLAAYGVEFNDLYDTTRRLADISSGLGVSFERIALAYGQVKSRSWLDGKELRQFAYAGIPLLESLSKMYSKTTGKNVSNADVKKMISNREVSFEDVQKVLFDMTEQGGKFYNMQEVLSETLLGRYNKLIDALEIMWSKFASGENIVGKTLKTILNGITNVVLVFDKAMPIIASFFTMFAMRKLGGTVFGALGGNKLNNLLSAKNVLAQKANEDLLSGKKLGPVYQNILATQGRITQQELQQLRIAGVLTAQEEKRLSAAMRLKAAYDGINRSNWWNSIKTMGSAGMSLAWGGIKSGFSSLLNFFGGVPGLAITGAIASITAIKQRHDEIERSTEQTRKSLEDRAKQINDYLGTDKYGKSVNFNISVNENLLKAEINAAKRFYQEMTGMLVDYKDYKGKTDADEIMYLKQKIQLLGEAAEKAQNYSSLFNKAQDKTDWVLIPDDGIDHNLKVFQEAYENYITQDKNKRDSGSFEIWKTYVDKDLDKMVSYIKRKLAAAPKSQRKTIYTMNRNEWISKREELSPDMQSILKMMFNKKMGYGIAQDFSDFVGRKAGSELKEAIQKGIREGKSLEEMAKGEGGKIIKAAMNGILESIPDESLGLQYFLDNNPFYIRVITTIGADAIENDVLKLHLGKVSKSLPLDVRNAYSRLIEEYTKEGTHTSTKSAAKSDLDKKKKELDNAIQAGATAEEIKKLRALYDTANDVWNLLGYTDDDKKKGSGTRKEDLELKRWRNLFELMKQVNSEYKKYVTLYDKEKAISELRKLGVYDDLNAILGENFDMSDRLGNSKKFNEWMQNQNDKGSEQRKRLKQDVQRWLTDENFDVKLVNAETALAKSVYDLDKMAERFGDFENLRKYGATLASSLVLRDSDAGLMYRRVKARGSIVEGDISKDEQIRQLQELLQNLIAQKGEYIGKNWDTKEIDALITDTSNRIFALTSGKEQVLDNVNVQGSMKEYSRKLSDVYKNLLTKNGIDIAEYEEHQFDEKWKQENLTKDSIVPKLYEVYKRQLDSEQRETIQTLQSILEGSKSTEISIKKIDEEYDKAVTALGELADMQFASGVTFGDVLTVRRDTEKMKLRNDYGRFMNNPSSMTIEQIQMTFAMIKDNLSKQLDAQLIDVQEYYQKISELRNKLFEGVIGKRNDFNYLKAGWNIYDEAVGRRNGIRDSLKATGIYDEWKNGNDEQRKAMLDRYVAVVVEGETKTMKLSAALELLAQAEGEVDDAADKMRKTINKLSETLDGVVNAVSAVGGFFGNDTVGRITGGANGIVKSGMNIALNPLDFNSWGSAINSIGEIVESIDQSQIEEYERQRARDEQFRNKLLSLIDNKITRLTEEIKNSASVSGFNSSYEKIIEANQNKVNGVKESMTKNLLTKFRTYSQSNLGNYYSGFSKMSGDDAHSLGYYMWNGGDDSRLDFGEGWGAIAKDVNQKFGTDITRMEHFMDLNTEELKYILDTYINEVAQIPDWADALESLYEYNKTLEETTKTMFFLGKSFDDWFSNIISQFSDVSSSIVNITSSMYSDIDNAIIKAFMNANYKEEAERINKEIGNLYSTGGNYGETGFTPEEIRKLKYDIQKYNRGVKDGINDLKRQGLLLGGATSSLSSSISGITEDTAEELAAYLNTMRVDVSIQTTLQQYIADNTDKMLIAMSGTAMAKQRNASFDADLIEEMYGGSENAASLMRLIDEQMPSVINSLANTVASLKAIEANTGRNANNTDEIYRILNNLTNGSGIKRLSVAME